MNLQMDIYFLSIKDKLNCHLFKIISRSSLLSNDGAVCLIAFHKFFVQVIVVSECHYNGVADHPGHHPHGTRLTD